MSTNQLIKERFNREFLHESERYALARLLEGEQAAVDSYNLAISRVKDHELIPILENCRDSHSKRIETLRGLIKQHGDLVEESAGLFGALACFVEAGAVAINDRVAMSVLAAGEEVGLERCESQMNSLHENTYEMVEQVLIPAQKKTLETMNILCACLKAEKSEKEKSAINQKVHRLHPRERKHIYNPLWFG